MCVTCNSRFNKKPVYEIDHLKLLSLFGDDKHLSLSSRVDA